MGSTAFTHCHTTTASYDIIRIVYDIYVSPPGYAERYTTFKCIYPEFVAAYPRLFESVCTPRFNYDKFYIIASKALECTGKKRKSMNAVFHCMDIENKLHEVFAAQQHALKNEYLV